MIVWHLAWRSLANRKVMAILTVLSIAVSVMLLLGVEKIRTGARESFAGTISDTDLIVGARAGGVQLLLYSVFHIGDATNNISWESYQDIADRPEVDWIVPITLGDSHFGYRVVGTSAEFFDFYHYRDSRSLTFGDGGPFAEVFQTVVGADVAADRGYQVGDEIVISHGLGSLGLADHDDKPFLITGVLDKTGTPVDRSVLISLESVEAIHVDWQSGARIPGVSIPAEIVEQMDLTPEAVTAALIGLNSRIAIFTVQRFVNEYSEEPLTAVIPGVALLELWEIIGAAETALLAVSIMVVLTAILGMITTILSTLNERRREMAILRAVGARPIHIFVLLMAEAGVLALSGILLGTLALYGGLFVIQPLVEQGIGLYIPIEPPRPGEIGILAAVAVAGLLAGAIPALRAYFNTLADGIVART